MNFWWMIPFRCFVVRARLKVASANEDGMNHIFLMEFICHIFTFPIWELNVACLEYLKCRYLL